jgi:hypothetical protein
MKCNIKTIKKYSNRRHSINTGVPTDLWAFTGRLPHFDMKLIGALKRLIHAF